MLTSLHPICLMARTDAELTTLFHSFYLMEYLPEAKDTRVVQRFPQDKPQIDTIESGLKLFIINGISNATTSETTGKFVFTSSDSSRYFAFFRSYDTKVFVSVSNLPTMSFSRTLFELLQHEPIESIPSILLTLCEIPIFPAVGMKYDIALSNGTASLKFSCVEQVEDVDIDYIVLNVMTPAMLVKAWEAIILEKKVLVISNTDSIITACVEYLRRMMSPLVIVNTYVPLLPLQLIETVDAPVPYLLGSNTKMLKDNVFDLSDTVVVDLDTRSVTQNINKSGKPETHASINLISRLTQEVNDVMVVPLGEWSQRATNAYPAHSPCSPFSEEGYVTRGAKVLQIFRKANLDLISARNCSVKAFWRRAAETTLMNAQNASNNALAAMGGAHHSTQSSHSSVGAFGRKNSTMMGFNYLDGVCSGFMQLAKELNIHDDENISHFTPCWVELDQYVLSIYQYADDLPVLYILLKDIETISPCAIEPEGHVFELVIKDQMSYRFTVTDTESRQKWISTLDRRKQYDFSGFNDDNMLLDVNYSAKMRLSSYDEPNVDLGSSTVGPSHANTHANAGSVALTGVSLWNGYELVTKPIVSEAGGVNNASGNTTADNTPTSEHGASSSTGSTVSLGLPLPCPPVYTESAAYLAKTDNLFRFEFSRTQTMNFIHQKLECGEFQDVFKEMKIKTESLIGSEYCLDANLDVVLSSSVAGEDGNDRSATLSITEANTLANASGLSPVRERTNSDGAIDKTDFVAPALHRTSTSFGGAAAATVAPAAVKQRLSSKMFGGFFKKLASPEDEHAANLKLEQEREAEAEALRQKQISGRKKSALQSQIFVVTATYRRTQSELNALIVENRQAALQDLVLQHVHQSATHDSPSPHATVTYPMRALLTQLKHAPVIVKSPKKDRSRGGSGVISMPAVHKAADPVSSVPSSAWMDHLWLGLINKTYEDYKKDNPYTSLNQEVDMQDHDAEGNTESTELMRLSTVEIDEFILDAERTKNERITRRQIREILLAHLTKHHESNLPRPEYAPYSCIRNVLIGYLHETLDSSALALQYYSKGGCLVEQRRLMYCLVQQFLVHIDKLKLLVVSEPSSPHLGHSTNHSSHHNSGMLNSMSALSTILATYTNQSNSTTPPVVRFLEHCKTISPLIGMHAYRLVLELLYTDLVHQLEAFFDKDQVHVNKELELGSFRTFPGSHRNVGAAQQSSARSRVKSSTLLNSDFEYTTGDPKSEAINNAITCLSIKVERTPGDLSVLLLTELKEILKTYCQSPAGLKNSKKASHGFCKLKLTPAAIEDLSSTSAYKAFEQHCCILQKVEPVGLSINERVQFWCNIYNTITVHAIISRGSPGTTLLERSAFMRSSKYNIGGVLHSLLDIEHGILRHASTKPMLFGPLTVNLTFAERDPRRKQVLEEPRPNISFVLCNACVTSPALVVLKDADIIAEEMKYYARRFFHEFVKLDPVNKTITLPGLMRVYWADFGGGRAKVLRTIAQLSGSQFASELKPYFSPVEGLRAKVEFAKLDWTPLLSISD